MSTFLARGLYPLIIIILARLLTPADFGFAAMALAVISLFQCFSDVGLYNSLVQQEGEVDKIANLAFLVLLPLGFFWFISIWIIAPYAAEYFRNNEVISLLRILGLTFIIQPFSEIPLAMLLRDLKFKALFYRKLIPQLLSGVTSVVMAFMGFGAVSLVMGNLVGIAGTALVVWCVIDWRPRLTTDMKLFNSMFRFGSFVSIQNILGWLMVRVGDLFAGRFLGASSLGFYRMGNTYGMLPLELIGAPFFNVVYPVFCKLHRNLNELGDKYLSYVKWISIASIPTSIAFIFVMPFVIPVLLGNKWFSTIPILQLVALNSMIGSIVGVNTEVYKAVGRPEIGVKFFSVRVLASVPVYYYTAQQSIVALAFAHVILTCFFSPINLFICSRVLKVEYQTVLKQIRTGLFLGLIFLVIGLSYNYLIRDRLISNDITNAFFITLFYLIFGSTSLFVIDRKLFVTLLEFIKNSLTFKTREAAL